MTPERQQELLAAIASAEPEFFATIDESKRAVLHVLAGDYSAEAQRLGEAGFEHLTSIIKGQAQVLGVLGGRRVLVSPSPGVILHAGGALLELTAALEATDAEPEFWS